VRVQFRWLDRAIRVLGIAILSLVVTQQSELLDRTATLPSQQIQRSAEGLYYVLLTAPLPTRWWHALVYQTQADSIEGYKSTLKLLENGVPLGPAHSLHADISHGRYSHWVVPGGPPVLLFSASDNSDPRSNRRRYDVHQPADLLRLIALPALILVGLLFWRHRSDRPAMPEAAIAGRSLRAAQAALQALIQLGRRREAWVAFDIALLAAMIAIQAYFLVRFGISVWANDGDTYVDYANQIAAVAGWRPVAEYLPTPDDQLWWNVLDMRMPGYPFLLAVSAQVGGEMWKELVIAAQITMSIVAGFVLYRTTSRISGFRLLGACAALIFLVSFRSQWDRFILIDSLYTSLITLIICRAALLIYQGRQPNKIDFIGLGLGFTALFLMKEMALALAAAAFPLMLLLVAWSGTWRQRQGRLVAIYLPLCVAVLGMLAWNYHRTGRAFITTGAHTAALWALVQVEKAGTPVFLGNEPLDRIARERLREYNFPETNQINIDLHSQFGLSAPDISSLATARYIAAWRQPTAMLKLVWNNAFETRYLFYSMEVARILAPYGADKQARYEAFTLRVFYLLAIVAPCLWLAVLVLRPPLRDFLTVSALFLFAAAPTAVYAAIAMDIRYVLFAIGPLLLMLAFEVRYTKEWGSWLSNSRVGR
jgi:hypothetical protein